MSDITFTPPQGWPPAPAGTLPPAAWTPDPSWPAPPAGWVFYRDAFGNPTTPPAGSWTPPFTAAPAAPPAPVPPVTPAPVTPAAPELPTTPTIAMVLDAPAAPFTPPVPPPTLNNAAPINLPPSEPPAPAWQPAAPVWTPPQPEGTPQFTSTPQFSATPNYGTSAPPQSPQPPYGQYQPGTPYGQSVPPAPPAPPAKKSPTALIIIGAAIVVAAVVFVVYGLINGFPWSTPETPSLTPPTIGTNSPTQTQPTETTKTEPAPAVNGLSLDQFRKLVTEAIPGVAEVEPMTVDTLVTSADFYDCTSMESLLSNLQAVASGSWKDLYVDFYLFDSPDSAKAMGVALKTCWHSGSLTVDESVKEYYGVTNYFYESANSTTDQVDNLAVYGNVAVWPDTFKAPFDEAQKAWEEQFIPSVFASGIAQVT